LLHPNYRISRCSANPVSANFVGEAIVRNSCRKAHIEKYGCPPAEERPEPNGHDTEACGDMCPDVESEPPKPPKARGNGEARGRHFEVLAFEEIKLGARPIANRGSRRTRGNDLATRGEFPGGGAAASWV
jgi:hypothetical protein